MFEESEGAGSSPDYQLSCVAAANAELHSEIVRQLDRGVERLGALLAP